MAKPIKIWDGSQWVDVAINTPDISNHIADTTDVHGISNTANLVYTNDSRLTDSRTPTAHASSHGSAGSDAITIAQSQVTNLTTDLSAKANLASPTFTGTPSAPTAAAATNTTQIATTAFVRTEVSNLVASAPAALDTLNELATALGNDPNFATTVNTALSNRVLTTGGSTITVASGTTVPLTIQNNGTGNSFVINDESSDTTPFVIDASGNVGIGGSSLTIKDNTSNGSIQLFSGTSGRTGYIGLNNAAGTRMGFIGWAADTTQASEYMYIYTDSTNGITFNTNTVSRMTIESNGRIKVNAGNVLEAPVSTNAQTGTAYTLVLTDAGRVIEMNNANANTLTVPTDASVNFPVGTVIDIFQTGAGQTTVGGAGVTINARPGLKLSGQWATATLIKRAANTWLLTGSLSA